MKDYFNLKKSKLLLLTLLAMIVGGVSPAWAQKELPYEYGFENYDLDAEGWTKTFGTSLTNNNNECAIVGAAKKTGSYGFRFSSYNTRGENAQYLISPELSAPNGVTVKFAYAASSTNGTEKFKVGYSTTDTDPNSFTWIDDISYSNTTWADYEGSCPVGTKYVAVYYYANYQYRLYIDDFVFSNPPSCIKPTGLTVSSITSTSVTVSWMSDADLWNVQYKKAADSEWTTVENVNTKPYTLTGLTPSTAYEVRVQTNCGGGDMSDPTDAVSFTTDCAIVTEFPFTENFNSLTTGIPYCWNNTEGTVTTASYKWSYWGDGHEGKCVRFNSYNNSADLWNALKTPVFNLPAGKVMQLTFWYMNPTGGDFSVYISNDGGATYETALATGLTDQTAWKQMELPIPTTFGENVVIVFKGISNWGNGDAYIYLDDVTIEEAPSCVKPTGLTASEIGRYSVKLNWTSEADTWNVQYKKVADSDWTTVENVTENPYTLTGLTATTDYTVRVQTNCGGGDVSVWTDEVAFTTLEACPVPAELTLSDITAHEATLTWTMTDNTFDVFVSLNGQMPTAETEPTASGIKTNTYTFEKLTSETQYYVWVRSVNGEEKSEWNGTKFTTLISCPKPTALAVSDIDATAVTLTWTAGVEGQDAWQVEYSTASDFTGSVIVDATENATKELTDLKSATTYYARVRANCGGGDYSAWTDAVSFVTLQVAEAAEDYSDDFEKACDWLLINGTNTNAWAWGSAANNGGEKALYISNDGGTTNAYTNNSSSMVYATKLFSFEGGAYTISYDWLGNGESNYDFLRVALVPATVELAAGTSKPSDFTTSSLPTGWIALDGGSKLNLSSEWKHVSSEQTLEAGKYKVVFAWFNDNMSGTNPAAAVDNFRVAVLACPTPTGLEVSDVTAHEATLTWAATDNTWEVYCTSEEGTPAADVKATGTADTNSYTFTELKGETKYNVWVRSISGDNKSEWAGTNFTTGISCFVPTALVVESVTDKTAIVSWTKGSEDQKQWELSYSTTSGAPNDGTIVPLTETSYELTGLTNGTTYYVYVRGVNSDDDKSQWSEVLEVIPGMFTVNNGTQTNANVPVYGYYVDNSTGIRSQFIIPAASLTGIANSELNKMVFYCNNQTVSFGNATFKVYMAEVENTTFSSTTLVDWSTLNEVYSGSLSISSDAKMTIEFAQPVEYKGGNLMIGVCQTAKGSYKNTSWYGVTTEEYTALGGYASSINQYKFLPKTSFYFTPLSDDAKMMVSTETVAFGKVHPSFPEEDKQMTFAIKNKGKADLTGINVSYSGDEAFSVSEVSDASIAAGGDDIVVTVSVDTKNVGDFTGTITVTAPDQEDATVNVSATVLDANKMFENFAGKALPEDWTTQGVGSFTTGSYASSYTWSFTDGYASYKSAPSSASSLDSYTHSLITPAMQFAAEGEKMMFKMKKDKTQYGGDISYLLVQYTTDGTTWTDTEEGAFENASISSEFTDAEVSIPGTAKKVRFVATGIAIDDVYGGQIVPEAKFVFAATDYNFGLIKEATTKPEAYTIQNPGSGELTGLSVTSDNENFVVAVADNATSIAARGQATFTVTMKADVKGEQNGKITVNADGFDPVEFNVSGYVLDTDAILVDFADNELPAGWTKSSFTIGNNEAYYNGYVATLISPVVTVAEGQKMVIYARGHSVASRAQLDVKTSTDNGATWSDAVKTFTTELQKNTTDYVLLTVDNIEPGDYKLKFTGDYVAIKCINGYTYNQDAPELGVTLAGKAVATGYNDSFGTKVKEQPGAHTYTIKNVGTGTLTGTITSSVPDHFTVSETEFSLAKDETLEFDLNLVFDENYGDKASVITIHPTNDGLTDFVINASATTKDPNIWEEDFENGIPAFWINENNAWTTKRYQHEGQAGPINNNTATLTTPRLLAAKDQVLTFDVIDAESEAYFLKAEYSNDLSEWTLIENYTTSGTMSFTAPADGYYYLRFTGNYTYIDNLVGFKLALPDHIATITASEIPTTGLKKERSFQAAVSVKEMRGVAEELTAKVYMGEEVIGTATGNVAANDLTRLMITATPTVADENAQMHIEVEYAGGILKTETVTRAVADLTYLTLDEAEATEIVAGSYDVVTLKHKFYAGWNTLCLPFTVQDITELLGAGAKAYYLSSHLDETLNFSSLSTLESRYPYIVYVPEDIENDLVINDVTIGSFETEPGYQSHNVYGDVVYFRGTYAPIAAGGWTKNAASDIIYGVTGEGKIARAGSSATMKGYRGYFDLPGNMSTARLSFFDETTGITHVISVEDLNKGVYNLNGQKVQKAQKGLYIINGKKTVVK